MTVRVKVKLNLRGINNVLRSPGVQGRLDQIGEAMADDAGDGFEYVAKPHRWTGRGYVQVESAEGARRQADDAVLERVMGTKR